MPERSPDEAGGPVSIVEADASFSRRSPADILRLVVAAVVTLLSLTLEMLTGDSIPQDLADLLRGLDVIPDWVLLTVVGLARVAAATLLVVGLGVIVWRRHWRNLFVVLVAAAAAMAMTALADAYAPEPADAVVDADALVAPEFPSSLGLAAAAAAVTASAPWLSRSWRRTGWAAVLVLAFARFITTPISFDTERAVLLGWLAGAAAVVALGGPSRRPRARSIADGLADVGVPLARIEQASVDARGSTPYFAEAADGRRLFVKALGEDERSADLLFRVYRWLTPRDLGDDRPASSLRHTVQHEALVSLVAYDLGVRTPHVVAMSTAEPHGFVLAYEAIDGRSLDRLDPDAVTDEMLTSVWEQVALLRRHRIAHRDLRLANLFVATDGTVWMIDFGFSELAASDTHLATDLAELLASSSLLVGPERAVANAAEFVGPTALASSLPRLRPWALSGATRTALKERPGLLDEVSIRVEAVAGAEAEGPS